MAKSYPSWNSSRQSLAGPSANALHDRKFSLVRLWADQKTGECSEAGQKGSLKGIRGALQSLASKGWRTEAPVFKHDYRLFGYTHMQCQFKYQDCKAARSSSSSPLRSFCPALLSVSFLSVSAAPVEVSIASSSFGGASKSAKLELWSGNSLLYSSSASSWKFEAHRLDKASDSQILKTSSYNN